MRNRLRKILGMSSALALAVVPVALTGCNDDPLTTEAASGEALAPATSPQASARDQGSTGSDGPLPEPRE